MKRDISWVTITEVVIASVFFAVIFTWLFSWISIISSYVKESNIKLNSMNLARIWVEKFEAYKTNFLITKTDDSWRKFFYDNTVWYYIFSWSNLKPEKITWDNVDNLVLDFSKWEWPLDEKWNIKNDNNWVSYYRLLKISDFDIISNNDDLKSSIFDCNINDNFCSKWIEKDFISHPFLSWAVLSSSWLTLEFSTWSIFNTKSLFIVDLNWSWLISSDFPTSTWVINWSNITYIDFSSIEYPNWFSWKTISFSWITSSWILRFWDNVNIWWSKDRAIFNLKNEISINTEDFIAYIFYPNPCQLQENFIFYNTLSDTKFSFPNDFSSGCSDTYITIDNNKITLSGSFIINNINENVTVIPKYNTKIKLWVTSDDYNLFSELKSPRTTKYWLKVWKKWVSSIYLLWVRVIWVENWNIVTDEVFEKYIVDL